MEYSPILLPKEVCEALDIARSMYPISDSFIIKRTYLKEWEMDDTKILNNQKADTIMRALVLGYRHEKNISDQLKDLYWNDEECGGDMVAMHTRQNAILDVLNILGIKYDWMEDAK